MKPNIPKVTIYGIDVIKSFVFFVGFLIMTFFVVFFVISPSVAGFRIAKKEYYQTKYELETITNEYKEKIKELKKTKNLNKKILNALKEEFNEEEFRSFALRYMRIYSIKKEDTTKFRSDFLRTSYIVRSVVKSPKEVYDFIDALKDYKYVLRVCFPVEFIKRGKEINLTLRIEHYKLADLKKR